MGRAGGSQGGGKAERRMKIDIICEFAIRKMRYPEGGEG